MSLFEVETGKENMTVLEACDKLSAAMKDPEVMLAASGTFPPKEVVKEEATFQRAVDFGFVGNKFDALYRSCMCSRNNII